MGALLPPATRLGKYELVSHVAAGGMAELYVARASGIEGFEKAVILKRILPQHAADPEFVQMFLEEARLAATLHHANVVQVFDIGVHDDSPFFTMEYIHGVNLTELLRAAHKAGRGLSREHALAIVAGVAAGLHHAHERGIVHRDVSPANVMVTVDGNVKVVDFGIAKAAARGSTTRHGAVKGKVAYMSPEQCRGERIDRRSDVFSIGILLYELTTGRRLFRGDSEYAIMQAVMTADPPAPTALVDDYPPALEAIVLRALARDPAQRHATAQELQVALEELAREARLSLSSVGLAQFVRELAPERAAGVPTRLTSVETPRRVGRGRRGGVAIAIAGALIAAATLLTWQRCAAPSSGGAPIVDEPDATRPPPALALDAAVAPEVLPIDAAPVPPRKHRPAQVPDAAPPPPPPDASAPPPPPDAAPTVKVKRTPLFGRDAGP